MTPPTMKILLLGSTGFIGSQFKEALTKKDYELATPRIEITDLSALRKAMDEHRPDWVLNCTGITGKPNVDWCETHVSETIAVNACGTLNSAIAASEKGVYSIHMGTGCQYNGDNGGKGYSETDEPNFFGSVYSRSKAWTQKLLQEIPNTLQLRIRIPIMGQPNPKNLIDKLVKYPKMINQMNSCSVIEDFIPASIKLMEMKATGVFNMTNIGAMDHHSIMELYREIVDPSFKIQLMTETEESELNKRRSNCVLNTDKREALGVHMPPLKESLRRVLKEYAARRNP
ncbi:sugar nucleotide-binding protein [Candidatus Peregrinibacteria bacterium]|nr:sugar nucleotide-binding protein [Candidatus Peregrinibacteria bacterium]